MRSRIDIKARLAAHILAAVVVVVIWISVIPKRTIEESRFGGGQAQPTAMDNISVDQQIPIAPTTGVSPVLEAKQPDVPPLPVEEPAPETKIEAVPVVPVAPAVPVEPVGAEQTEVEPDAGEVVDTPEEPPVPDIGLPDIRQTSEPRGETEPSAEQPAAGEDAADDSAGVEPETPTSEAEPAPPGDANISDLRVDPADPVPPAEPTPVAAVDVEPDTPEASRPQPDESGALVVADAETPEPAALPLPEIAGLEYYQDGLYWIMVERIDDERLKLLPDGAVPLYVYDGAASPPEGVLEAQLFDASSESLDADGAEHFLYALRELRKRPSGLVVAVVLPGVRNAAFFKAACLLAGGLDASAALAACRPELEQAGEARGEIVHRIERLDASSLRRSGR